jgi:TPP-dependent pyruvate/acetoin dehydrogenase alpha subunit
MSTTRVKPDPTAATESTLPREQLVEFLSQMLLIRRFEEKVGERFRAGELAGFLHACIGQEAVAVGVCRALGDEDVIASTHRAHGHVLAKGTPPNEVMAELYGKVEGSSHGYGGSLHLYDVVRGNTGENAVVGGGLPATVGAARAFKLRRLPRVAVAFFRDGATNIGTFHESFNLAQLWQVPAVFVCENNRWSASTPQSQHQPIRDLTRRAAAYGMRTLQVDGQDVEAVHLAAREALEHARAGNGPVFLLCETERLTGHYIGDAQLYRDREGPRRPRAKAERMVDAAVEFAQAGADPEPGDALAHVGAEEQSSRPSSRWERQAQRR